MPIEFERNIYNGAQAWPGSLAALGEEFKKEAKENLQFTYGTVTYIQFSGQFDREYGTPRTFSVNQVRKDAECSIRLRAIPGAIWAAVKTIYHLACAVFIGGWDAFNGDTDAAKVYAFYAGRHCIEILGRAYSLYDPEGGQYLVEESQFHETCYALFFEAKAEMALKDKEVNELIHGGSLDEKPLDPSQKPNFAEKWANITSEKDRKIKQEAFLVLAEECLQWDDLDMGFKAINEIYSGSFGDKKEKFILKLVNRYLELGDEEQAIKMLKRSSASTSEQEAVYFTLAEKHIAQNNEKRGLKLLDNIYSSDGGKRKDEIIFNLANERLANNDEAGCIELLGKINYFNLSEMKDQVYYELAEKYFVDGDMTKALKFLNKIIHESSASKKEDLIFKIAQWYFDQGQMDNAFKVVDGIRMPKDKERKAEFITKVANTYGKDQLKKALEVTGSVKKDSFAGQKFYLDQIERYCPQGDGHDEAIIEIARAFAVDSCMEWLLKSVKDDVMSGKIKDLTFAAKMYSRESILNKFQGIDTSNHCLLIREKYEAKGRDGICEALAEITTSLQKLY